MTRTETRTTRVNRESTDSNHIQALIERSRRDVLDLTLRNPLLNFRPSKRRGLQVVDERSREVFRLLVDRERPMYFLPVPDASPAASSAPARSPKVRSQRARSPSSASPANHSPTTPSPRRTTIIPTDHADVPPELLALLGESPEDPNKAAARHTDNKLQTALTRAALNLRLRETFRQARLSIEEQGVNILYLTLGTLRWHESDSSETERLAPLILIPVQLARSDIRESFKLTWTKDDIEPNLSLASKLRQDFGVRLPEMPAEDELDVANWLSKVAKAVARQQRWQVAHDEIHLGFFSFSKLLIYKDLDPAAWPAEHPPAEHPLAQKLFGGNGFEGEPSSGFGDGDHIDDSERATSLHPVLDADSSQTLAILDVMKGRNLVIQGPPGTGKSQTITNLVGEALANDRTVLFVAEKLAALEVVKRRLDAVHLGDACLELHSHKTNKRAVLDELNRTLRLGRPRAPGRPDDRVLLEQTRNRLNAYARAINSPVAQSELTPHDLVGRLARLVQDGLAEDATPIAVDDSEQWTREQFVRRRATVRELQELVDSIGAPDEHPWWSCGRLHFLPTEAAAVRALIDNVQSALQELARAVVDLAQATGLELEWRKLDADRLARLVRTVRRVADAPNPAGLDHRNAAWSSRRGEIQEFAAAARSWARIRSEHHDALLPQAWDENPLAERRALRDMGGKWWRFLSSSFRVAERRVRGLCRGEPPRDAAGQLALVEAILEVDRLRRAIDGSRELRAVLFPGLALGDRTGSHRRLADAADWMLQLRRDLEAGVVGPEVHDLLDAMAGAARPSPVSAPSAASESATARAPAPVQGQPADRATMGSAARACRQGLDAVQEALAAIAETMELRAERFPPGQSPAERPFVQLAAWLDAAHAALPAAQDIVRFNQLQRRAASLGIGPVADAAATRPDAAQHLTGLFERACHGAWLALAFRERPVLAEFDGATHAGVVRQFRELDAAQFRHNRIRIAERHWNRLPRSPGGGQLGVLLREFQKKTRHLPVRKLMSSAGRAVQSVKPVFMMSPLSIAKYIPPGSVDFDLVVFDEASQVRPVEALGAIIRGRQAVVVGDSKQLPPTSFFDRIGGDDEGEESATADLESILGMFCAQGAPERMLRWHYRSRHESLIAVSNHEFYDNRLVVFPSPDAGKHDTGLVFRHNPDASYERRGINTAEAKKVAAAVMEHARLRPGMTLGVAAFSNVQARRIEDEVDILRCRDPSCEAFFADHPEEPFFVKNLENVQGDERDVILISVGYGKIDGAHLPMNFGPLNREGGERRLNVLITRARRRCHVHSNFEGGDLDLRRSRATGVRALKTFLEYAQKGHLDAPEITGRGADSPFEEAVAGRLRQRGHDVVHQVGSAGFFVDLAVVDPAKPGRYLLGIECDGATYHSARSARDRDRLRQQVLEGLGWRIHRIWSTDWFRNPGRELARVEEAIASARGHDFRPPPPGENRTARPMEREAEARPEVEAPARPYRLARPFIAASGESLHEVALERVAAWIRRVVNVESPVHLDEATLRICRAAGVARAGSRIQKRIRAGMRQGVASGMFTFDRAGFLWRPDHELTRIRRRDGDIPPSLRNPARISREEIAIALLHSVRASFGIGPGDAVREAVRLFGFARGGARIVSRFREALDFLVDEGRILREGSLLRVRDE